MTTTLLLALTLTAAAPQAPAPTQAAPAAAPKIDDRFAAWIGCWRLEDDLTGAGARMCIVPDQGGVRLQTIIGTQRGIDELLIPDATPRPIVDAECKGTERSEWSRDGLRVFRSTQVVCGNDGPRTVASVSFLATGPSWINVQHVSGPAVSTSVRVQRYRRAINQNLADGTRAPQAPSMTTFPTSSQLAWSIDDVIEANAKLPAEALQAALSDVRHGFNLNKQTLVALDEAGVDTSIIDLMVALTFPKRFVVERASGGGGGGSDPIGVTTGSGWFDPFMSPFIFGAYANCYVSPYGYGYRSYYDYGLCGGYAPYSYYRPYGYWGGGGYYPGGGWVVVNPDPGPIEPISHGRVVNGRGYTQVRPRQPEPTVARVGGSRGDGSASGYSGGGSSSGGSSGVTSSGYSNGSSGGGSSSSGGDGGRTAVARPPGGE